tara:strand:- start:51 stop:206 length:156 start_codon:yes stop_codon:yes gene_type:complete
MPTYLRLFYYKKLIDVRQKENEQMEKAQGKGSSAKSIKRPTFNKPSKSTKS